MMHGDGTVVVVRALIVVVMRVLVVVEGADPSSVVVLVLPTVVEVAEVVVVQVVVDEEAVVVVVTVGTSRTARMSVPPSRMLMPSPAMAPLSLIALASAMIHPKSAGIRLLRSWRPSW